MPRPAAPAGPGPLTCSGSLCPGNTGGAPLLQSFIITSISFNDPHHWLDNFLMVCKICLSWFEYLNLLSKIVLCSKGSRSHFIMWSSNWVLNKIANVVFETQSRIYCKTCGQLQILFPFWTSGKWSDCCFSQHYVKWWTKPLVSWCKQPEAVPAVLVDLWPCLVSYSCTFEFWSS